MDVVERYQKLGLREALTTRSLDYCSACRELSYILKEAYDKCPKNVRSLIFDDTLAAFRSLPMVEARSAVFEASILLQAAEASLPKQKRAIAVTEFKHGVVAKKRQSRIQHTNSKDDCDFDLVQMPQDILINIFSFLDLRSLVASSLVCRSWSTITSDKKLWQAQFAFFFGSGHEEHNTKLVRGHTRVILNENEVHILQTSAGEEIDWKRAFREAIFGKSLQNSVHRGYCRSCGSVVWLYDLKYINLWCSCGGRNNRWSFKPIFPQQVAQYLLGEVESSSSDSDLDLDPDPDAGPFKLWAYPKHITNGRFRG